MLTFNITRVIRMRGISEPFAYLVKAGFPRGFASRAVNNRLSHVDLAHLEKLCVMFRCTPNDLLEWRANDSTPASENLPLNALIRTNAPTPLSQMLKTVSIEKMEELESIIRKEIEK